MDLRRRRSQSKGREPTADERLDALLEEARASEKPKEPTRRTQSLEPSRMLTPSLRKTSSALTAGASRERSAPEEVRAIENRDREGSRQPQGPPVSFLPVVPPFFPRVRTPCGHGAQVIIEGREKQSDSDGGERNKDKPTTKTQTTANQTPQAESPPSCSLSSVLR